MITTDICVWNRFKAIAEQALQHDKADVVGPCTIAHFVTSPRRQ